MELQIIAILATLTLTQAGSPSYNNCAHFCDRATCTYEFNYYLCTCSMYPECDGRENTFSDTSPSSSSSSESYTRYDDSCENVCGSSCSGYPLGCDCSSLPGCPSSSETYSDTSSESQTFDGESCEVVCHGSCSGFPLDCDCASLPGCPETTVQPILSTESPSFSSSPDESSSPLDEKECNEVCIKNPCISIDGCNCYLPPYCPDDYEKSSSKSSSSAIESSSLSPDAKECKEICTKNPCGFFFGCNCYEIPYCPDDYSSSSTKYFTKSSESLSPS